MKDYLRKKNNFYLMAYDGSIPAGYIHVTFDDKKKKDMGYISEFFINKGYRGFGIGKRLIKESENILKKNKIKRIWLTATYYKNKPAIEFYKKNNYKITKKYKKENYVLFEKELK